MKAFATKWVAPYFERKPNAALRLFCFPYAGGGASIYSRIFAQLTPTIEICAVQPPGRENRLSEPLLTSVADLAKAAARALEPYFDMQFAFFGHSLGALVAYELTQTLRQTGGPTPCHLIASAHRAPQLPSPCEPVWGLPDPEFKLRLKELNGTPGEVLENSELQALLLPLMRADFRLDETYSHPSGYEALDCPVTVFGGRHDAEVRESELRAWNAVTRNRFELRMIDGDHFFIHSHASTVTTCVTEALRRSGCAV